MDDARKIIVLTAPSGAGKTSIARLVLAAIPGMRFAVSATTRPAREGEVHGRHYFFLSEADFRAAIADDSLLEYEEVYPGRLYGTLVDEVARATRAQPVLLDIEVKGATNVKNRFGDDALVIFVKPPSLDVLAERLAARATENAETFRHRIDRARIELTYADRFDEAIVNDDLARAADEVIGLIRDFLAR